MRCLFAITLAWVSTSTLPAQSWPTYRHDNRRSGVSGQPFDFPLELQWTRLSKQPPQPAWTGPAKWDAWAANSGLQSMRNFDPCFYVTAADGRVYFGSSVDDAVHALDAETGQELWVRFTGAAVRFPPTIDDGRAYFGSDDGKVYCCDAASGETLWSMMAAPGKRRITSNRKIISLWPVRTGVLVADGRAKFAASLVPWEPSLLWSVDAETGGVSGADCYRQDLAGVTLQGALLASEQRVYVPQGRAAPLAFERATGKPQGAIGEAGGVFCILTEDERLLAGPKNQKSKGDQIRIADAASRRSLASFSGTNRILVAGAEAWLHADGMLKCLERDTYVDAQQRIDQAAASVKALQKKKASTETADRELADARQKQNSAWRWEVECPDPSDLIKSGDAIIVGLSDQVRAYDAKDGSLLWTGDVDGIVHGLAAAEGRLMVSTGRGHIYAFGAKP